MDVDGLGLASAGRALNNVRTQRGGNRDHIVQEWCTIIYYIHITHSSVGMVTKKPSIYFYYKYFTYFHLFSLTLKRYKIH